MSITLPISLTSPVRRTLAPVLLLLSLAPAVAAQGSYLGDRTAFERAWALLSERIGESDLLWLRVEADSIAVLAGTEAGDHGLWTVRPGEAGNIVTGPAPMSDGPVFIVPPQPFSQGQLRIRRFRAILDAAPDHLPTETRGEVTAAVATLGTVLGRPGRAVKWNLSVRAGGEFGQVYALSDGTFRGADISHTKRGASMNLLTQADWPFDGAEAGFREIIGDGDLVYEIKVLRHGVEVEAALAARPGTTRVYRWNGGAFSRHGFDRQTATTAMLTRGKPFAIAGSGLARLPEILAAARAEVPAGWGRVADIEATRPPATGRESGVLWTVRIAGASGGDPAVVRLRPDASVVSVTLPPDLRRFDSYMSPEGISAAIAAFGAALGPDAMVFEMILRADRVSVLIPDAETPARWSA